MGEAQSDDVFLRPAAHLIDAVLQYRGAQPPFAMSAAHAAHYQEWRRLIEVHVQTFENANEHNMTKDEIEADEARLAAHMELIDAASEKILAERIQSWGDLLPCAEVAFWYQWAGVDPQGPHAKGQMKAGPMSGGEAIDEAVAKLLEGIFTLAGVGSFAEVRHG